MPELALDQGQRDPFMQQLPIANDGHASIPTPRRRSPLLCVIALTAAAKGEATAALDGILLAQTRSRGCQQAPAITPALWRVGSEQKSEPSGSRSRYATESCG